jgi:16S rRNA (adenine1518-N6/adenine1519-N6)-dimethyltransferase
MTSAHTRPRKRFGQHFLIRPEITARILGLAELSGAESVLEIGPGRGALTAELRKRCRRLVLIEIDRDLVADLRARYGADPDVRIVEADVLNIDLAGELGADAPVTVVANLPYNISTPIISRFVDRPELYRRLVLMLQREVAERICAEPGGKEYGALTVAVQLAATARIALHVPPSAFKPQPKVDSAVIVVEPFARALLTAEERAAVRRVTRELFAQRRKQLGKLLRPLSPHSGAILESLGIDTRRRPETLSPADFVSIARALAADGGTPSAAAVGLRE